MNILQKRRVSLGLQGLIEMSKKIGVSGSANCSDPEILKKAFEIGREIASKGAVVVTGATTGVSYEAVKGAGSFGGKVLGVSPAADEKEHLEKYRLPVRGFDSIKFTGKGRLGRNMIFVRSCDAMVFIAGAWGTLNEFSIAGHLGKKIGVLTGSNGLAEKMPEIEDICGSVGAVYSSSPKELLNKLA